MAETQPQEWFHSASTPTPQQPKLCPLSAIHLRMAARAEATAPPASQTPAGQTEVEAEVLSGTAVQAKGAQSVPRAVVKPSRGSK